MNEPQVDKYGLAKTSDYTAVNPRFATPQAKEQMNLMANPVSVPTTISGDTLRGGGSSLALPDITPTSTFSVGVSEKAYSKADTIKSEVENMYKEYQSRAEQESKTAKGVAEKYLGLGVTAIEDKIAAMQTPEFKEKKAAGDEAYKQLQSSKQAQMAELEVIRKDPMLTDVQRRQFVNSINSKYAYTNAYLSMTYDIATKDYQSALDEINTVAQLKQEAYQPFIDYYTQLAQNEENDFDQATRDYINAKKEEYQTLQQQEIDFEKQKGQLMIQAKENGASNAIIQAMARATDMNSLVQSSGQYTGDMLERQIKQAQLDKLKTEISQLNNPNATEPIISDPNAADILSQTGLSLPAFAYLTQGTTALTRMSAQQRLQYINEAETWAKQKGIDISTLKAQYTALSNTVTANVMRNNQAAVAENELLGTIDNLKVAAEEAGLTNLRAYNIAKIWGGSQLNKPAYEAFKVHLTQLRNELAMYNAATAGQLDSNGNIRENSEADMKEIADNTIQNGFAAGSIDGFETAIKNSRAKLGAVLKNSIDAQNKQVWSLFGVGQNYKGSSDSNLISQPKEGDTKIWEGKTYKVVGGNWIEQ